MTVPAAERKAGPFNGNGSTTSFPFTFKVFTSADVEVVFADTDGVETVLTLDSDYSVALNADQDATPGGSVGYPLSGAALATGEKLSIAGALAYEQETDIPTGGNFNPTVLENALDKLSMQTQQLAESVSRAAKVPITNAADADTLTQAILVAANNITGLQTIVTNINDIQTVADDLNEAVSEINTVAVNIANVNTVGGNITNVNTVAGVSAAVSTVATNIADIQNAEENAAAAEAAQAAAEAARDQVLAVYDSFDDRYLGAKTSDPTVDNDGNALVAGAIYFNSVSGVMRLYTGSAWVAAYVQGVASSIGFTPAGNIAAANVQAAIEELDNEKLASTAIGVTVQAYDVDTAKTDVVQSFTKAQRGTVVALTDGATITPDFSLGNNFSVTLGGNRTLANPTNLTAGQSGVITITQDGTGSRTLAYGSYFKFPSGTAPTLTTTASAVDVLCYYVESSTRITARLMADVK